MGKTNVSLRGKNVLGLADFSAEEIRLVLETAKEMKNIIHRDIKKVPTLRGKSIVTLFYEPSTRTRTSFELAGKYLGADVVNITAGTSSIVKGESLRDTLYTIEAMGVDAIVMRHKAEGAAEYAARVVSPVIINAGDGAHAHPSQGLLNLFTIEQHKGHLEGLKVAILGDVLHSRVARSDIYGMRKMGMEVHIAGPKTLLPRFLSEEPGIVVHERIEDAIKDADVIYGDIWASMGEEALIPERAKLLSPYRVTEETLKATGNPNVLYMHCLPSFHDFETKLAKEWQDKGVDIREVSDEVFRGKHSVVFDEAENRMHSIKAVLVATIGK